MKVIFGRKFLLSVCLIVCACFLQFNGCSKILVYAPRVGHSHVNFMGRMADILVKAGHEVVVFLPDINGIVKNNGTKLARIITRPLSTSLSTTDFDQRLWTQNGDNIYEMYLLYKRITESQLTACINHLNDKELLKTLKNEHFDLAITEMITFCGYAIFKKLGIDNYISASAVNSIEVISDNLGVSSNPSYVPAIFSQYVELSTFSERLMNTFTYLANYALTEIVLLSATRKLNSLVPGGFDLYDSIRRSSMSFVNAEELLDFPRLESHKIIYIGGIAVSESKPLKKDYQQLMNDSVDGVVLVSFGSVAKSSAMTDEEKMIFADAFRAFPKITFVWKYENDDEIAANIKNVVKRKWVPQSDLLRNPKLRAFISHCGLNSVTESVIFGIPLICVPLFGDQMRNAKMAEKRNVAMVINKQDLNTKTLKRALEEVLYGRRLKMESKKLARMIKEKPISPQERLIKYTQFVLDFGPLDCLDSAGNNLNFFQYFLLDLIIPIIVFMILCTILAFKFLQIVYRRFRKQKLKSD